MTYEIIQLEQGSADWLALRKTKITATDTGIIMGLNPWKTPIMLLEEKWGLRKPQVANSKMLIGSILEEHARDYLNEKCMNGLNNFKPVVMLSTKYNFMMASLDGFDEKTNKILEIKCGKSSHEMALRNEIPPYYFSQCQKQIFVSGRDELTYFSYQSDEDTYEITVRRDDDFIEKMIIAETEFYKNYLNFTYPEPTERDFVIRDDVDWIFKADDWKSAKSRLKEAEVIESMLRQELIEMCDGQSCQGAGVNISKTLRRGNIDYSKIECLKDIDLEKYRGKAVESYRFTEMK